MGSTDDEKGKQVKPTACAGCGLESAGRGYCATSGPADARLLVLGEAPGEREIAAVPPCPMVGPTGWEINEALQGRREAVRVTNVRRCLPPEHEGTRLHAASIDHCGVAYLDAEVAGLSEVRTILCVGGDALRAVMGLGSITKVVGSVWTRREAEAIRGVTGVAGRLVPLPPKLHTVVADIHPSAALHGSRWMMPTIKQIVARALAWSERESGPGDRLEGISINVAPSETEVEAMLAHSTLAMDVETPRDSRQVLIVGIADTPQSAVVTDWSEPTITMLRRWLADPAHRVIGHNFMFDMAAMYETSGIEVRCQVLDSKDAAALVWPPVPKRKQNETTREKLQLPWHSLALCKLRVSEGEAYWKEPDTPTQQAFYGAAYGHRYPSWSWPRLYCGLDTIKTLGLMVELRRRMKAA